jgi:ParB-like chromosome segregation protein Spo0J
MSEYAAAPKAALEIPKGDEDMPTLFEQLPSLAKVMTQDTETDLDRIAPLILKFLDPEDSLSNTKAGLDRTVERLNALRRLIAAHSPFSEEPVDLIEWVPADSVHANDYNPNTVAPPEMELLRLSIMADGYTQPIVTMPEGEGRVVIDGFHRHRVGKEMPDVNARTHGYLPVVRIRQDRRDRNDRIAATIRHNRARGKHRIDAMSDIVVELKRRNWPDERIARELGMEADEVLRLCQVSGIADLFSDDEFSASWDVADPDDDFTGFDEEQVV